MTNTNPIDPAAYRAAVRALDIAWANLAAARAADMRDNSPATLAAHIAAIAARDIALETLRNTRAPRY